MINFGCSEVSVCPKHNAVYTNII